MLYLFTDAPAGPAGALFDYGLLGIFCGLFAIVIGIMAKQFLALHKRNETRIKELEDDLQKYLAEDRAAIIETLKDSNEVLKGCKDALRENNRLTQKIILIIDSKK